MKNKKSIIILALILIILIIVAIVIGVNVSKKSQQASTELGQNNNEEQERQIEEQPPENNEENPAEENPAEEEPTETEQPTQPEQPKPSETDEPQSYFIKVNYQANVVTIYTKDTAGNYTVPYKAMVCSCGTATPTSGTYTIPGGKWDRWTWGQMVGNVWAQYYVRIKGSILFHSVPYTSKDKSTLEYWEYDKLGTTASAGCVRLTCKDAKWIYDNCVAGTKVEFYADSNPGPLGKPTAQKISEDEEVRGWDPTDPSKDNPWKNYTPSKKEEPEVEQVPEDFDVEKGEYKNPID